MKTADLIPLILFELASGDKYGFELTKEIEDKSNQQIQIKQPTLYTVLKKLEKSKFITSYWEDSEIGGKRHYYKITENGKAQLSTLPSFDVCLQNALMSEQDEAEVASTPTEANIQSNNQTNVVTNVVEENVVPLQNTYEHDLHETQSASETQSIEQQHLSQQNVADNDKEITQPQSFDDFSAMFFHKDEDNTPISQSNVEDIKPVQQEKDDFISIMDLIADNNAEEQKASVVNATKLFNDNSIDTKTELEVNKSNSSLLKNQENQQAEQFAESKEISKFVDKLPTAPAQSKIEEKDVKELEQSAEKQPILEPKLTNADYAFDEIKYVDYVDFKTKKEYIYAKKLAKGSLIKTFLCSIYAILMLVLCGMAVKQTSTLYYCMYILTIVSCLAYLAYGIRNNENLRLKAQQNEYKPKFKTRLIVAGVVTLIVITLSIICSVSTGFNTISSMFNAENFANIYAPLLLVSTIWFDILLAYIINKTIKK